MTTATNGTTAPDLYAGAIYLPPPPPDGRTRWALMRRLSAATETNAGGLEAQSKAGRAAIKANGGGVIVLDHAERGTSAFDREEPWEGYVRLWDAIEAGEIDGVAAFNFDRYCRDEIEQALMQRHAERHGVRHFLMNGSLSDSANPDDNMTQGILALLGRRESQIKRMRMRLNHARTAEAGIWRGCRPFGLDIVDGVPVPNPTEADLIRAAYPRALSGTPLGQIAREWNAKGVEGVKGGVNWTTTNVRQALEKYALCGVRTHKGVVVKEDAWEPIVSRAEVEAFRAGLSRTKRPGRPQKSLLAGMIVCECHGWTAGYNGRNYAAAKGPESCCSIRAEAAESFVTDAFLFLIADGAYLSETEAEDARRLTELADSLDAVARDRAELAAAVEGGASVASVLALTGALDAREAALRTEAGLIAVRPSTDALAGIEDRWEAMSVAERRAALGVLFARIELIPCGSDSRPPTAQRLRIIRRTE